MAKYILQGAGDINWMALFALLTFFILFVISAVLVFKSSSSHLRRMAHLPLEEAQADHLEKKEQHEK